VVIRFGGLTPRNQETKCKKKQTNKQKIEETQKKSRETGLPTQRKISEKNGAGVKKKAEQ